MSSKTSQSEKPRKAGRSPLTPKIKEERRQIICLAARRVIQQAGIENASIARIAASAEVRKTSVYENFSNKDDLLHQVALQVQTEFVQRIEANFASRPRFIETLRSILHSTLDLYFNEPELSRLLAVKFEKLRPEIPAEMSAVSERILDLSHSLMRQGIDERILRPDISAEQHSEHLIDLIVGSRERLLFRGGHLEPEKELDRILDRFLNGSGAGSDRDFSRLVEKA